MKRYFSLTLLVLLVAFSVTMAQENRGTAIGIWMGGANGGLKTPDLPFVADNETGWYGGGGLGLRLPIKIYDLTLDAKATFSGKNTFRYCGELNFLRTVYRQAYVFAGPNVNFWHLGNGADSKGGPGFQIGAGIKADADESSTLTFETGIRYATGKARGWTTAMVDGAPVLESKDFNFHSTMLFVRFGLLMHFTK